MPSETFTIEGHIIDNVVLPKLFDEIIDQGGTYEVVDLQIGVLHDDASVARIRVTAPGDDTLTDITERLRAYGANPETAGDAQLAQADADGAFPSGFYSTTNLETEVRIDGRWVPVERPEMDCGIVVVGGRARTVPMSEVEKGMAIVMRGSGIRVLSPEKQASERRAFEFMSSDISSEKPKVLLVERVAEQMRAVKAAGKRILWVAGPAVVHTGSGPDLCALIRAGFVDAFFAGNGVAAHDIESNMYGTSLGVYLHEGMPAEHGHEHHIRTINEIRRYGSFGAAINAGAFDDGIVHHLVTHDCKYLFGGSVRDDGPLPEVVTDMLEVQRRLRELIWGADSNDLVGYCIVVGTMLHGIATGNCLPASVPLVCVDINHATLTKLMDRGSWQSLGIITDVGLFVRELAERLAPDEVRAPGAEADQREGGTRTRR